MSIWETELDKDRIERSLRSKKFPEDWYEITLKYPLVLEPSQHPLWPSMPLGEGPVSFGSLSPRNCCPKTIGPLAPLSFMSKKHSGAGRVSKEASRLLPYPPFPPLPPLPLPPHFPPPRLHSCPSPDAPSFLPSSCSFSSSFS